MLHRTDGGRNRSAEEAEVTIKQHIVTYCYSDCLFITKDCVSNTVKMEKYICVDVGLSAAPKCSETRKTSLEA